MSELQIKSKGQFFDLCASGEIGNTPTTWSDLARCRDQIRDTKRVVYLTSDSWKNTPVYWQGWNDIQTYLDDPSALRKQFPWGNIYAAENPPRALQAAHYAFQFDIVIPERWMIWNVSNKPWGSEKRAGRFTVAEGASVPAILKHHLGEHMEDLLDLEERFPTATIEATLFPFRSGMLKRNLLIWEVRHY